MSKNMIRRRCACAIRRNARARNYRAFRIFDLRKAPRDFDSAAFTPVTRPSRSFHFARASANARCVARSVLHTNIQDANPEHAHQVIFVGSRLNILLSIGFAGPGSCSFQISLLHHPRDMRHCDPRDMRHCEWPRLGELAPARSDQLLVQIHIWPHAIEEAATTHRATYNCRITRPGHILPDSTGVQLAKIRPFRNVRALVPTAQSTRISGRPSPGVAGASERSAVRVRTCSMSKNMIRRRFSCSSMI
jgi:hypothetical protein